MQILVLVRQQNFSKLLTSCLTAVKKHVIKYCEKVYERSGKNLFWSIKNSGEILDKLKARDFNATSLSTYDFSTLYTTLPQMIEWRQVWLVADTSVDVNCGNFDDLKEMQYY